MLVKGLSKRSVLIGVLLSILILRRCYDRYWDPNLIITFFDVGQGDSALIQFPFGKTMLIDGGGGWGKLSVGERVLIPELLRLGVLRLDHVVLSHPDSDHAFGLLEILQKMEVGQVWLSSYFQKPPRPRILQDIEQISKSRKIKINHLINPYQLQINGVSTLLTPLGIDAHSKNDRALLLGIEFSKCRALFTGDIEQGGELEMVTRSSKKVHLLKVPHHGSLTSSTRQFLKAFSPRWAVVSVGFKNSYRHPRKEILHRYRLMGINLLRTDFHGAVRLTLSPEGKVSCETYLGDCGVSRCD
ncbi:MBL fold metallo-hydrolase [bacterium]|nr:MBL fold metallo-hydrolase [bacterium]